MTGTRQADERPKAPAFEGRILRTPHDVAAFLGVPHKRLIHELYEAPETDRYTTFEIPKRSGGMRAISAPRGLVRRLQEKLAPILSAAYGAHPAAHGFIGGRSIVSNANVHVGQNLVLNIDLEDFFPSINFGRVRGLFMAQPFDMGPAAATIFAQICTYKNGLPQGAPTSPVLSNFIATALDRRLTRLARQNKMRYSRYADDITFSTKLSAFPASIAQWEHEGGAKYQVRVGDALEQAIEACGFSINHRKVRIQSRHVRQSVTGLPVNTFANVERTRVRQIRAMLHAWEKFGLDKAGREHFVKYRERPALGRSGLAGIKFRNAVYGHLAFIKMVRGAADPVFLRLCAKVATLDPNPSKFVRQVVFGAADFEIFISHASEDREAVARPIYEACERIGLKAFLDDEHIAWGEHFTQKINLALGAARTVLAVISNVSVNKDWPATEVNAALAMEVAGDKVVVPLLVGKPDLSRLPLIRGKDYLVWDGDAGRVAAHLRKTVEARRKPPKETPKAEVRPSTVPSAPSPPRTVPPAPSPSGSEENSAPGQQNGHSWFSRFLRRRPPSGR